jgi:toxin-antitoxin system PIN domain toxin
VILIDVNLLVYAHVVRTLEHERARDWLDDKLNSAAPVGLPWASLLGFLRLVTNRRIFDNPEPVSEAWRQVHAWLDCEPVWIPEPGPRHADRLGDLLRLPGVRGSLIPDAHLAALAIEHGLVLCSTDGDFGRFPGLRWENPLVERGDR